MYCTELKAIQWDVAPLPMATVNATGNTIFCSPTGAAYQWYVDGNIIPGANDTIVAAVVSGYYSVVVTSAQGCTATSPSVYILVEGLAKANVLPNLNIWPNPGDREINFVLPPTILSNVVISVYADDGRLVYRSVQEHSSPGQKVSINTGQFTIGIYRIEVIGNGNRFVAHWIKR
jgi:hypothetical protein